MHGRVASHHKIAHLMLGEEPEQVFEIGVHLGYAFWPSTFPALAPMPPAEWQHHLGAAKNVCSRCASHPGWNTSRHTNPPWSHCFC
jgi:hypothetical protein